jgi:hypothetical protein
VTELVPYMPAEEPEWEEWDLPPARERLRPLIRPLPDEYLRLKVDIKLSWTLCNDLELAMQAHGITKAQAVRRGLRMFLDSLPEIPVELEGMVEDC